MGAPFANSQAGLAAAQALGQQRMAEGAWISAHAERAPDGTVQVRFIRFMTTAGLDEAGRGGWQTSDQDDAL